ncbi:poly-gamma-glutamate synthase PgsB [Corynebacterium sp. USCH3]|uniref:poly-gamma-glutamate synthase PgsB n=1 Tax=Corynebacterium sp. USCH3 TaxID=3024840 RepID=UPI00309DEB6A
MLSSLALSTATAAVGMAAFRRKEVRHRRRMGDLSVNVHVNGIRGKSTVTRMLGGVLRESGVSTIAKTTGTYACVIDPDAGEHPILRTGPADIAEQYRFLAEWLDGGVEALVVECMAVKPRYQALCQDVILRSPVSVITNVRLDHQDEMGHTLGDITRSLCNTVPTGGVLVTGERDPELLAIMREHCGRRGSRLVVAEENARSRNLVSLFPYRQFEENVAVVLAVAGELGIDEATAVRGMLTAAPDPGTTRVTRVGDGRTAPFYWVPMFAVNDWESTVRIFHDVTAELPTCRRVVALNNRSDRTDRAAMFVDLVARELIDEVDRIVLFGDIQEVVRQKLLGAGVPAGMIALTQDIEDGQALVDRARAGFDGEVAIFGMVNIHTDHVTAMEGYVSSLVEQDREVAAA